MTELSKQLVENEQLQHRILALERALQLYHLALKDTGEDLTQLADVVDDLCDGCKTLDQPEPNRKLIQRGIDKANEFASHRAGFQNPICPTRNLFT